MNLSRLTPFTILLALFVIGKSFAFSQEKKKDPPQAEIVINDTLEKLLSVDGVDRVFEVCKKEGKKADQMANCIWPKLSADQKKKVQTVYAKEKSSVTDLRTGEVTKVEKPNMIAADNTILQQTEADPAIAALSKYYGEKLAELLDPNVALTEDERKKGVVLSFDHTKFIDLYKTSLGKAIVNAFTSYCIDTDPGQCTHDDPGLCVIDEKNMKDNRALNLASLKNGTIDLNLDSPESLKWRKCIKDVPEICSAGSGYSKDRACLIVDYVKAARKNILIAEDQIKFYEDLKKDGNITLAQNFKSITDPDKASADAILTITSKDVEEKLQKITEASQAELDKCYDSENQKITDPEACKKFLDTNRDSNEASVIELALRHKAQEETLKEQLSDEKQLTSYLKEEGYQDDQIKEMTSSDESIEKIKAQIVENFKREKEAIIKDLNNKIDKRTSSVDGNITSDSSADVSKLGKIREEIATRASDLANLVQFSNVVSSYLTINEKTQRNTASDNKKTSRNASGLLAEVVNLDKEQAEKMKEKIKEAGIKKEKQTADLEIETINKEFLKYDYDQPKK